MIFHAMIVSQPKRIVNEGCDGMKVKFNVTGMTCAACSARVEKVTNAVEGVEKAEAEGIKKQLEEVGAVVELK